MTTSAVHGPVRAGEYKGCAAVVKARKIAPRLGGMAGLAAQRPTGARHAHCELAFVRVSVAGRAAQKIKVVQSATAAVRRFVTVNASDGDMTAGKHKAGLLMTREVESGRVECGLVVTLLAPIEVRCARELVAVYVLVAGDATRYFDFEHGGAARRNMALRAGHFGVLRPQRERRGFVVSHGIFRGFEAVHRVARFTAATVGPRKELPAVWIGLVAVGADIVRDRSLEVSGAMTGLTPHIKVLSCQRILGLGVVELSDERALLPCGSAVAGCAPLLELSAMRIVVARRTAVELESDIFRYAVGAGCVTLLTSDLAMQPGQRELGL